MFDLVMPMVQEAGTRAIYRGLVKLPEFAGNLYSNKVNSFNEANKPLDQFKSIKDSTKEASAEEKDIYSEAKLEKTIVNGREALIRTDIDYDAKVGPFNETNLQLMMEGKAPVNVKGEKIELHHIGQKMDAPLAELTTKEHRGKGNDSVLHTYTESSEIDRNKFNTEKENYWKARAEIIMKEGRV